HCPAEPQGYRRRNPDLFPGLVFFQSTRRSVLGTIRRRER
ncbi:hypothetical protein V3C99_014652, partial [Haemonchus contortus]